MPTKYTVLMAAAFSAFAQTAHVHQEQASAVPLQPLAQQVRRIEGALEYLGQPLSATEQQGINEAVADADETSAVHKIEQLLDKLVLVNIEINPESRVKVEQGAAKPELVEGGTRLFLVKVLNQARYVRR